MIESQGWGYLGGMRTAVLLSILALVPACPSPDPQSDDEGTSDTDDTDTTETETGEDESTHGTVKVELVPFDPANPPFAGTTEIAVTVLYEDCLLDFYLSAHPELQQDGLEGATVFEEWTNRLCDPTLENVIPCQVTDIDQTLIEDTAVFQVRVTFAITDAAAIENGWLYVGPLPTAELVGGCEPRVELRGNGVIGRDADGVQIWGIKTLPAQSQATTDQATPLRVEVGI